MRIGGPSGGADKDLETIPVVRTRLKSRGDGKDDLFRVLTQYWSLDGQLLATVDPCDEPMEGYNPEAVGLRRALKILEEMLVGEPNEARANTLEVAKDRLEGALKR